MVVNWLRIIYHASLSLFLFLSRQTPLQMMNNISQSVLRRIKKIVSFLSMLVQSLNLMKFNYQIPSCAGIVISDPVI